MTDWGPLLIATATALLGALGLAYWAYRAQDDRSARVGLYLLFGIPAVLLVLAGLLPQRLAQALAAAHLPAASLANLPDRTLRGLGALLNGWQPVPTGSEGYAKAEVTLGGVDTRALSSKTMEANTVPGLFVIGEAADVTGWLGGYNFQWAWSSGWCAGQAV